MEPKTQEQMQAEMNELINEVIEKEHISKITETENYKAFVAAREEMERLNKERKAREARRWMKAIDISVDAKISISVSYKIIRELGQELQAKGYFTNRGITSRAFFCERYYCDDEPHPFMDIEDITAILPISQSEGYSVIRELNQIVVKKGCKAIRGRASRKIFREKFYGVDETDASE